MKWIDCSKAMPHKMEDVLVWVIFQEHDEGQPEISWIDDYGWAMGSAKGFTVTHWMRIEEPSS